MPTRARARDAVLRGRVTIDGQVAKKPGQTVAESAALTANALPFVSRGGEKLAHALTRFAVPVAGRRAIDVGASTGGFTQVLLGAGAAAVIALDVGHGQLAPSVADDPRVHAMEGVNARHLRADQLPFVPDLAVIDVSFISLRLVLGPVFAALAPAADVIALVKPQFEVGREAIGKGGIVTDETAAAAAVAGIAAVFGDAGFCVVGQAPSPITGGDGNAEVLLAAERR
ncbi:MAG: TlyA family RNA methyltransferase [Pseudomonadota bacterium]